jgi:two-component system, OmpR family, sensor kinase
MGRLSLRARLLLGVVVLTALGLVAADVATYSSLRSFLLHRVDTGLAAGRGLLEGTSPGGHRADHDEHVGSGGPGPQGIDWYQLQTLSRQRVRGGPFVEELSPPRLPAQLDLPAQGSAEHERVTYFDAPALRGGDTFRVRASIEPDQPNRILFVASSLDGVDSTLHRLVLIELIATAAVLTALAALALWVVRLGLRPLRRIEQTAAAITAGDLSQRIDHPDPQTEVGRVGSALNTMLDRIEASDRRLRRFIADASHELRTPLTAVRAYAELFGRGAAAHPDDLERSMAGIRREAERMSVLVDDLLLLARLDEGRPLEREPVDLAAVVGQAVDAARVVEPERPIESSVEPATVTGDEVRLRQVVDNLLANARAHTPRETPVSVALRRVDGRAELTVADHGPGLSADEAGRVFERFYRADDSRARSSGGAGLGLSIVAAVTEAHEGKTEARQTPGGGATFVITLPLGAAADRSRA